MPRPCQRRRESAAAQRRSNPNPKPSRRPPPPRPKARQKAIHNAVRQARASSRGNGRGGGRGGNSSRNQRSGTGNEANQDDFASFASNGNNFPVLHGVGSRHDPITLDEYGGFNVDSMEDGELTDSGSDDDDSNDLDTHDAGALTINVQVHQGHGPRPGDAVAMFSMAEALRIYNALSQAGFPLHRTPVARYGVEANDNAPEAASSSQQPAVGLSQYSRVAFKSDAMVGPEYTTAGAQSSSSSYVSSAMSRQPSASTATSAASAAHPGTSHAARDYVFDWGFHSGKPFAAVPETYLRSIAGNPSLLDKHPGVKEAFDFHRPDMRNTVPTQRQRLRRDAAPVQAPSRGRLQGTRGRPNTSWTTFTFPAGAHQDKKLNEVPENYLRTLEGMAHVVDKWAGLREALLDYNAKTGRKSKITS
jgi:hypothetical protein